MRKIFILSLLAFFCSCCFSLAQVPVPEKDKEGLIILEDTLKTRPVDIPPLPFELSAAKRLSEEDIENKKEGFYVTGLPRLEFDPIRGFGAGGNVFMFHNKSKNDPFFYYTPYRHSLNLEFFIFENGRVRYALNYDAPYIFNSKWRFRADAVLWEDPNAQYWGIGRQSLQPLRFRDKRTGAVRNFRRVKEYEENLALAEQGADGNYYTDYHYNNMLQQEQLYNMLFERVFLEGRLRLMFGMEALFTQFSSYNGQRADEAYLEDGTKVEAINNPTLLDQQIADGTWERFNLAGLTNGNAAFTSILAGSLIYDTRDLEPDASRGLLLEYSHEHSPTWFGSDFNFHKAMVQAQVFHTFATWRNGRSRLTFAGLAALGHIWGQKINFVELWDLSSQAEAGGILVLGGGRSIRGFREARFVAPTVGLVNLEMRARLYDFRVFRQHLALGLTQFYDFGTVWDNPRQMNLTGFRGAPGLGARIAWNQATILRFDYARSREGGQFFFGFSNIF
jgi:hypothetical protein